MKELTNKILYGLIYGVWYALSLLPFRILFLFSDFLYFLIAHVVKYRHKVIWKNLKESFPEKTDAEISRIEKDFYHWFCDYLVETIKLMSLSPAALRKHMQFTGMDKFNEMAVRVPFIWGIIAIGNGFLPYHFGFPSMCNVANFTTLWRTNPWTFYS